MTADKRRYSTDAIHVPMDDNDEVYPCADCGVLRSKKQGGTTFTVCDECWHKYWRPEHD